MRKNSQLVAAVSRRMFGDGHEGRFTLRSLLTATPLIAALLLVAIVTLFVRPVDVSAKTEGKGVPFHSEITWHRLDQLPVPAGRCTEALPPGLSYLWFTNEYGTATSTHLGTGPYYVELCVYGILTAPNEPPPANGTPMGFNSIVQVWTAANGDQLKATGTLVGVVTSPVFAFVDSLAFQGGTGRFANAEGQGLGYVYPDPQTTQVGREVYDAWILYKRK